MITTDTQLFEIAFLVIILLFYCFIVLLSIASFHSFSIKKQGYLSS